jgi:pyruvate-formate lyase-activating enzyme
MGGQSTRPSILKKKYHLKLQKYMDFATLDLKAMDERTRSSKLYIIVN